MSGLTAKQAKFVTEYLVDLNATQAAIRAGYSKHTAKAIATENLSKPTIAAAVAIARHKQTERTEITADLVLAGLLKEATDTENPPAVKVSAWSWLGRYKAMFTDRLELPGELPEIRFRLTDE